MFELWKLSPENLNLLSMIIDDKIIDCGHPNDHQCEGDCEFKDLYESIRTIMDMKRIDHVDPQPHDIIKFYLDIANDPKLIPTHAGLALHEIDGYIKSLERKLKQQPLVWICPSCDTGLEKDETIESHLLSDLKVWTDKYNEMEAFIEKWQI